MSVSGNMAVAAWSQMRQGWLGCLARSDPYNAVTCLRNMLAFLPPDSRPTIEMLPQEPPDLYSFTEDPDGDRAQSKAWAYFRAYSFVIEEAVGKYTINQMSRMKL